MSFNLGNLSISAGTSATFEAPNNGVKAIIIGNNSGLTCTVSMESGGVSKTLYPGTLDWFAVNSGFSGNIKINPQAILNNPNAWPASTLTFDAIGLNDPETSNMYPVTLSQPAVTATASGNPLFSATVGFGSTASRYQALNIANPSNSGVVMTFHSARCYTSDTSGPACNLLLKTGADLNLGTPVTIVSHQGSSNAPSSVGHATAEDQVVSHGATSTIEVMDMNNTTQTQDFLAFPDSYTLNPGNNLYMQLTSGSSGNVVRLTFKWSESPVQVSATLQAVNMTILTASTLTNDGNTANTGIIESTPSGQATSANYATNDGQWLLKVLQASTYHQFLKTQTSGNPLLLGQAGDIAEVLGELQVDQGLLLNLSGTAFSSTGTATLYQPLQGTIKLVVLEYNGFKNTGAAHNIALPVAFTAFFMAWSTDIPSVQFLASSVAQTVAVITALASTGGTTTNVTTFADHSWGGGPAFDTIALSGGNGSVHNGLLIVLGI